VSVGQDVRQQVTQKGQGSNSSTRPVRPLARRAARGRGELDRL